MDMDPKSKLVAYKGGGFDGCFWQYNFFFWDKYGTWFDIFHSGCRGVDSETDAFAKVMTNTDRFDPQCFDLTKDEDIKKFQAEYAADNVIGVIKSVNEVTPNTMWFICEECSDKVDYGFGVDPHGEGGIVYANTTLLCEDCWSKCMEDEMNDEDHS